MWVLPACAQAVLTDRLMHCSDKKTCSLSLYTEFSVSSHPSATLLIFGNLLPSRGDGLQKFGLHSNSRYYYYYCSLLALLLLPQQLHSLTDSCGEKRAVRARVRVAATTGQGQGVVFDQPSGAVAGAALLGQLYRLLVWIVSFGLVSSLFHHQDQCNNNLLN